MIRAICPSLKLCAMLEIKTDLTLSQLKTILKGYYKADDTSDLYQKLISISQEQKESAQEFLFRATELKDRLLFASKEGGVRGTLQCRSSQEEVPEVCGYRAAQ